MYFRELRDALRFRTAAQEDGRLANSRLSPKDDHSSAAISACSRMQISPPQASGSERCVVRLDFICDFVPWQFVPHFNVLYRLGDVGSTSCRASDDLTPESLRSLVIS